MLKSAIIFFLVNYGAFLWAQDLRFSREFVAMKRNVPIAILNRQPGYFHLLRYNKEIHDLTLERRSKPQAEMLAFTPLKLDSVNASWFNYEHLDYLLHELNHTVYFIFERVLNTRRELYVKSIDSTGKSSGFKLLAQMEMDNSLNAVSMEYKLVNNQYVLLICVYDYLNGSTRKTVQLIDLKTKEKLWLKKLPAETPVSGYSTAFTALENGQLYYLQIQAELTGFRRKYQNYRQTEEPVFEYNDISICYFPEDNSTVIKKSLELGRIKNVHSVFLESDATGPLLFLQYAKGEEPDSQKVFALSRKWHSNLNGEASGEINEVSAGITAKLNYYDGTDYKSPALKTFDKLFSNRNANTFCFLADRKEDNTYKEMILTMVNAENAGIIRQTLIPRRISYFDERSRFRNLQALSVLQDDSVCHVFLFEHRTNETIRSETYEHRTFNKLKTLKNANLVLYTFNKEGMSKKRIVYQNKEYNVIPLSYHSNGRELLLYFNRGKQERFAILSP